MNPKVSIVIPCRNEENYIAKNIASILAQDYEGEIEVLVVDGMSKDGTRDIVNGYDSSNVKLIDNSAQFTPNALNLGVAAATGEIFIILGGHAFLNPDFVARNVALLNEKPEVGCVGGQIINIFENEDGELISKAMSSPFGVGNATFRTGGDAGYVDTVAFGAYRKSIHEEIGGFDEDLVRNQDDEYNYKVVKAGYKIYFDPTIISNYYVRGSISKLYKQYYQYGYWKVYVNKKHKTVTTVRQLIPLFFVLGLGFGFLFSLVLPYFGYMYLMIIIAYLGLAVFSASQITNTTERTLKVAKIFPILHFSYGWGYTVGIVDFLLMNKKPSRKSKTTSRD